MTRDNRTYRTLVMATSALVVLATAMPGRTAAAGERWLLRLSGISVAPDLDFDEMDVGGQRVRADAGGAAGFGVEIEYLLNDRLGVTAGVAAASPRVGIRVTPASGEPASAADNLTFRPVTAGLDIHLTPGSRIDLSVGLFVAYVNYGDLDFDAGEGRRLELSSDDDLGWGATIGGDYRLGGGPWSIALSASYFDTVLGVSNREDAVSEEVDVDPFIFSLGVGYRF